MLMIYLNYYSIKEYLLSLFKNLKRREKLIYKKVGI